MTIAEQTLTKIQSLARLYEAGYSSKTVDATIAKLVDMERSRLQAEADHLLGQMRQFEATYKMMSAEFYRRFQAGELGDDADLFEWSALYQMWVAVENQRQTVRDQHGRTNIAINGWTRPGNIFVDDGTTRRTIRGWPAIPIMFMSKRKTAWNQAPP